MIRDSLFKIGDKVGLINDTLKGVVIQINKQRVTIQCDEGFEYTCDQHEIIKYGHLDATALDANIHKVIVEKEADNSKKAKLSNAHSKNTGKKTTPLEVDLHIHELVASEKGMRNYDMLSLQLKTAKKQLEFAMDKKIQRVVFIHGIGEGVLRKALYQLLKKYPVEVFEASYSSYGQGATEVYIYQNT